MTITDNPSGESIHKYVRRNAGGVYDESIVYYNITTYIR
jgi:hypothetical protein